MSESRTKLKVAIAQTSPVDADARNPLPSTDVAFPTLEANLRDALTRVEAATAEGADIVVFPEYFLQGLLNEGREFMSFPANHLLAYMASLAKEHNVAIVGSIVFGRKPSSLASETPAISPFEHLPTNSKQEARAPSAQVQQAWLSLSKDFIKWGATEEAKEKAILKNTAVYLEAGSGELVGNYEKRNLWHPERDFLLPGKEEHAVFDTPWGKAGLMICWDMSHPAAAQALADQGAQLIFAPTYWTMADSEPHVLEHEHHPDMELHVVQALCLTRSYETETAWIMCNAGGDKEGDRFMGGSGVWVPLRGKIGGFERNEIGMRVVDLDLRVVEHGRDLYKIREDWSKRQAW